MRTAEQQQLIDALQALGEVVVLDSTEKTFIHYFSTLNLDGIADLLTDEVLYEHLSKNQFLGYLKLFFDQLKQKGITQLTPTSGTCTECYLGKKALSFVDDGTGDYVDFVLLTQNGKVTTLNFCFSMKSESTSQKRLRMEIVPGSNLRI